MLLKLIGYILAVLGLIGIGFFKDHNSIAFKNDDLWFVISFIICLLGLFMIYIARKIKAQNKLQNNIKIHDNLKRVGERIVLTNENCIVKENNYYSETVDNSLSEVSVIDALYAPNRNVKQNYIKQTAIIFYYTVKGNKLRLTSQTFPLDREQITGYINSGSLVLFVNRFDANEYYFELNA
jgi:hypothetical protein